MKPIAFVIPWYGDNIRGGAETACNYLAHSLQNAGQSIEVFTSCVKEASDDRGVNTIKPGVYKESGIIVRRFLVRENRDINALGYSNKKIYYNDNFNIDDEKIYFKEDINSPEMYKYIRENKDNYKAFIFIPYMYGIVYNGSFECTEKSILIPCLHDESYAYMQLLKDKMSSFKGMIFNAKQEYELAKRLYDLDNVKCAVLGLGVDTDWKDNTNPHNFKEKYNIYDEFILFAGRKDSGKKADELALFFMRYKEENPENKIKLVFLGGGDLLVKIPSKFKNEILDLGFVSTEDKRNAFAAASIFCNPSYYESFSLVIMESWVAKRPIIVSGHCAVTKNICIETNGGIFYNDYEEFYYCVQYLLDNKDIANEMGINGQKYVLCNFTHEKIAENYMKFIKECNL